MNANAINFMSESDYVHTEQKHSCEVLVIQVDFSRGMEIYPNLTEQLKNLDIGVLGKPALTCCYRIQMEPLTFYFFFSSSQQCWYCI